MHIEISNKIIIYICVYTFIDGNLHRKMDLFVLFVLIFTQGIKSWLLQDAENMKPLRIEVVFD